MDSASKIDCTPESTLYQQIASTIKEWIESGRLKPGESVPSTRHMAILLGVGRATVIRGYELLISQGYLRPITGVGTIVNQPISNVSAAVSPPDAGVDYVSETPVVLSEYGKRLLKFDPFGRDSAGVYEFSDDATPHEFLPIKEWRQLLLRHLDAHPQSEVGSSVDPFGYLPLRKAVAEYLRRARGARCTAEQVAIFSSAQHATDLVARLLLNDGDLVAVENPGFPATRMTLRTHGAKLLPISVDRDGLLVNELQETEGAIKLVYVTTSHHEPTGALLSLSRRRALLNWARSTGALIVEDDLGSESPSGQFPIPAIQGLDQDGSVFLLSTFWKTLFPILPVGVLVVPMHLVPVFRRAKSAVERLLPIVEQRALRDFIHEGLLERHIKRTQRIYARRQRSLIHALTVHLKGMVDIARYSPSMHLLVRFNIDLSDAEITACALEAGVPLTSTRQYYLEGHQRGEFLIAFASLDEDGIMERIENFSQSIASRLQACPAGTNYAPGQRSEAQSPPTFSCQRLTSTHIGDTISPGRDAFNIDSK